MNYLYWFYFLYHQTSWKLITDHDFMLWPVWVTCLGYFDGGVVASWLMHSLRIKWSMFDPWPGTLCCVPGQDTLLSECSPIHRGSRDTPSCFMLQKLEISTSLGGTLNLSPSRIFWREFGGLWVHFHFQYCTFNQIFCQAAPCLGRHISSRGS